MVSPSFTETNPSPVSTESKENPMQKYGARTCVFGHLHGEQAFRNAPEGLIDGVYYRLVSLDRLSAVPLRIF